MHGQRPPPQPLRRAALQGLCFDDIKPQGYVFNAASKLLSQPDATPDLTDVATPPRRPSYEAPPPSIAKAFLAKAATPPADSGASYAADLAPYYLCQYELEGMAITAYRAPEAAAPDAPGLPPALAELARPLLVRSRPSLIDVPDGDVRVAMRPTAEVRRLAAEARLPRGADVVPLADLLYDDAFVHSLVVRSDLPLSYSPVNRTWRRSLCYTTSEPVGRSGYGHVLPAP